MMGRVHSLRKGLELSVKVETHTSVRCVATLRCPYLHPKLWPTDSGIYEVTASRLTECQAKSAVITAMEGHMTREHADQMVGLVG